MLTGCYRKLLARYQRAIPVFKIAETPFFGDVTAMRSADAANHGPCDLPDVCRCAHRWRPNCWHAVGQKCIAVKAWLPDGPDARGLSRSQTRISTSPFTNARGRVPGRILALVLSGPYWSQRRHRDRKARSRNLAGPVAFRATQISGPPALLRFTAPTLVQLAGPCLPTNISTPGKGTFDERQMLQVRERRCRARQGHWIDLLAGLRSRRHCRAGRQRQPVGADAPHSRPPTSQPKIAAASGRTRIATPTPTTSR